MASKKRREPLPDHCNMNWRYDLTLSGTQALAFDGRAVAELRARAKVAIATRKREAKKAAKEAATAATEQIAA